MKISLVYPALQKALSLCKLRTVPLTAARSFLSAPLKKFYKNVSISQAVRKDGDKEPSYEILLDQHKLRTPGGNLFLVPNEALALAVAQEWDSQKKVIRRHCQHITTLCYRVLDFQADDPTEVLIQHILQFLDTDTLCFRCDEPDDLVELQRSSWDPVIKWVEQQYLVRAAVTHSLTVIPTLSQTDREKLRRLLSSYNRWGLIGLQSCAENLKSLLLTLAVVDGFCSVPRVVELSRLEQLFQVDHHILIIKEFMPSTQIRRWGEVPSYHDIETVEVNSRVSAAVFLTLVSHRQHIITKMHIR